jgi:ubiquinone/menaquinone biosynthesis C-methylase UbiE
VSGGNELLNAKFILEKLELAQGMKVADLGCGGAGHFVFPAAALVGSEGVIYAVDILKTVLQGITSRARLELFNNIETVWSNLEICGVTKIEDNSLDAALLINILFQTKKHTEVIKEAIRLIKPGGKLLIIDWKMTGAPFGPAVAARIKKTEIMSIVEALGLKQQEEFAAGPYHFGLIFIK